MRSRPLWTASPRTAATANRRQFAGRLKAPFRVAGIPGHFGFPCFDMVLPCQRSLLPGDAFRVCVKAYPDRHTGFNPAVAQGHSLPKMEIRSAPNYGHFTTPAKASCSGLCSMMCSKASHIDGVRLTKKPKIRLFSGYYVDFEGEKNGGQRACPHTFLTVPSHSMTRSVSNDLCQFFSALFPDIPVLS